MSNPLQQIIDAIGGVHKANRSETMSHVDVINRLTMNERTQHNMNRMDAQVDAHMRKQHGDCYEAPDLPDMAEHRINSPTINIGGDVAQALLAAAAKENQTTAEGAGVTSPPTPQPQSTTSSPVASGQQRGSGVSDFLKTAALIGATSIGTGAVVSYLADDSDTDTNSVYEIEAVPFDPTINPNP